MLCRAPMHNKESMSCHPVIGKGLYKPLWWEKLTKYLFAAIQTDRTQRASTDLLLMLGIFRLLF